ncbi:MAG: FDXHR family putative zinc-binding protein [Gammaproteobacteria bacterium]
MTHLPLTGNRCRCSACGQHFNSVTVFDRHRTGSWPDRRCLSPAEMSAKGWLRNDASFWITGRMPLRPVYVSRQRHDQAAGIPDGRGEPIEAPTREVEAA